MRHDSSHQVQAGLQPASGSWSAAVASLQCAAREESSVAAVRRNSSSQALAQAGLRTLALPKASSTGFVSKTWSSMPVPPASVAKYCMACKSRRGAVHQRYSVQRLRQGMDSSTPASQRPPCPTAWQCRACGLQAMTRIPEPLCTEMSCVGFRLAAASRLGLAVGSAGPQAKPH